MLAKVFQTFQFFLSFLSSVFSQKIKPFLKFFSLLKIYHWRLKKIQKNKQDCERLCSPKILFRPFTKIYAFEMQTFCEFFTKLFASKVFPGKAIELATDLKDYRPERLLTINEVVISGITSISGN